MRRKNKGTVQRNGREEVLETLVDPLFSLLFYDTKTVVIEREEASVVTTIHRQHLFMTNYAIQLNDEVNSISIYQSKKYFFDDQEHSMKLSEKNGKRKSFIVSGNKMHGHSFYRFIISSNIKTTASSSSEFLENVIMWFAVVSFRSSSVAGMLIF